MPNKISSFFEALREKKVAIIGLGVSHNRLIDMLIEKKINVTLLDKMDKTTMGDKYSELEAKGVHFDIGDGYLNSLENYDIVFRAPGVYFLKPELVKARESGVVITSEMEVFFDLCPCKIFAVTGSDGKTTTTTLISEMLKADGKTVHIGGNIGRALLPEIEQISQDDFCVVELSSFQLISMRKSPDIAVITNISPNHLDVHKDMQEYIDCKVNLIQHQNAFSKTVLSFDNQLCKDLSCFTRGKVSYFSRFDVPTTGTFLDEKSNICAINKGQIEILFNKSEIKLPGIHNVENYLAAIAAVREYVNDEAIIKVAREFGGVEHRIEFVRELDGVKYYNDSIASSPTRTIAGLNSFEQKLIIIAGGYDKKIPYEPLAPVLVARTKLLILLGATAPKIEKAVRDFEGFDGSRLEIINVSTLEDAVSVAREKAQRGDIVSLSPASASFDLYKNFEERGKHFKAIINAL